MSSRNVSVNDERKIADKTVNEIEIIADVKARLWGVAEAVAKRLVIRDKTTKAVIAITPMKAIM